LSAVAMEADSYFETWCRRF